MNPHAGAPAPPSARRTGTGAGGRTGQEVGTVTRYEVPGNGAREDTLVPRTATADALVTDGSANTDGSASGASTGVCTGGTRTVTPRPGDGKPHHVSADAAADAAGRPRAPPGPPGMAGAPRRALGRAGPQPAHRAH
ncbi:hypothetical protein ACE14D_22410, partial [Streptomyces sp. Act-28]